jgi:N-methylhydantoinase A/oxoprolinase/acetone carboxylase beta subunit
LHIGVDVGGTNTDAVLVEGKRVLASHKTPTTADVEFGVMRAIRAVLEAGGVQTDSVRCVMIGTTQFTNAFVERRHLVPIGVLRLAAPASTAVPPLYDWPDDLIQVVGREVEIIDGGYEFDGNPIRPLDELQVRDAARRFHNLGIRSIAISCSFALVNPSMERRAAEIVRDEMPDARVSLSAALGRTGLLERENAAAMNASLAGIAPRVVASFRSALRGLGISAPLYVSQNDGTLLSANVVAEHPVLTFASGPTNSIRGAAFLSGLVDAVVADIGGTTTDVGCLVSSFPRESALATDIGGVRTNFRMPDLISIGLGGGSLVELAPRVRIGPKSVGFELNHKALVFGGDTLTATDIAVAAGAAVVGDPSRVQSLPSEQVKAAQDEMHRMLEEAIDRIKTSREEVPLVLVGGGSVLISRPLKGVSEVQIPCHSAVANAVGAAIAQVGGEVDAFYNYERRSRDDILEEARHLARERAVAGGASVGTVRVVEIEEIPVGYLAGRNFRVRVKAIGDLELGA